MHKLMQIVVCYSQVFNLVNAYDSNSIDLPHLTTAVQVLPNLLLLGTIPWPYQAVFLLDD